MNKEYDVTLVDSSKPLYGRDLIYYKDFQNSRKLMDLVELEPFIMHVTDWAHFSVHNEKSKDSKDYDTYVFIDGVTGDSVTTSSVNVFETVFDIISDMSDVNENYDIKFYRAPSKNRTGQFYLAATIA